MFQKILVIVYIISLTNNILKINYEKNTVKPLSMFDPLFRCTVVCQILLIFSSFNTRKKPQYFRFGMNPRPQFPTDQRTSYCSPKFPTNPTPPAAAHRRPRPAGTALPSHRATAFPSRYPRIPSSRGAPHLHLRAFPVPLRPAAARPGPAAPQPRRWLTSPRAKPPLSHRAREEPPRYVSAFPYCFVSLFAATVVVAPAASKCSAT